jgi:sphingolipid delta-4 desaturase
MPSLQSEQSTLIKVPLKKPFPDTYCAESFDRDLNGFHFMDHDEPHYARRKMILDKHPEIKTLMKLDPSSFWLTVTLIIIQTYMCYLVQDMNFWPLFALTYAFGGVIANAFFVLVHDLTHFTAFRSKKANQFTAILANLGNGIPTAMAFQKFHSDHHMYLGRPNMDPDMPCSYEISFFRTSIRKVLHIIILLAWYVVRPYCQGNKAPTFMEIINIIVIIAWDALIFSLFGWKAIFYLVIGSVSALGPNPVGWRYFAEHFEYISGQDTYSYYGPFNIIMLNVGYHVEHHDFPNIPWRNLPKVKEMAPEFYDTLPDHNSYILIVWKYICDPKFGPWCRIGRTQGEDIKRKQN